MYMLFFIHFPHFTGLLSITCGTRITSQIRTQVIDFCQRSRFSFSLFFSLLILFFCFFLPVFCNGGFYILLLARTGVPVPLSSSSFLSFLSLGSLFQACFRISDKKRNNNNHENKKKMPMKQQQHCISEPPHFSSGTNRRHRAYLDSYPHCQKAVLLQSQSHRLG
jgi:hypothetical protein